MKRSSLVKIGVIVGAALVVSALGTLADGWMRSNGGESIAGNTYMLVLLVTVALVTGVLAKDRNREVGSADAGTRSQALGFLPKPGMAQVILFRDDKMAAQIGADVIVDDRLHTQLSSPHFTLVDLSPGSHRITVDFQGRRAEHALAAREGEVLALHVKMRMSLTATNPSLEPMAPADARQRIGKAPMALPTSSAA